MSLKSVEELRAKGWYFQFTGDGEGWQCFAVGTGLAHGHGSGETLEKAAECAIGAAKTLEDDPKVLIKAHGAKIEKLSDEIFGKGAFQGLDPVESPEPGMPRRIAISIAPKVHFQKYHEQSSRFVRRLIDDFPREVSISFIIEEDWPEERAKA